MRPLPVSVALVVSLRVAGLAPVERWSPGWRACSGAGVTSQSLASKCVNPTHL